MTTQQLSVFLALAFSLAGCRRHMTLQPVARHVAVHCINGEGEQEDETVTLAMDFERGKPDMLAINNQKVAAFDSCEVVVVDDDAAVCV